MWLKIPNMCTEKEQNIVYCNSLYFELYLYVRKVKAVWKFKNPVKGKTRVWKQPSLGAAITDCTIYSYSVCMSNAANNKTFLYLPLPPVEICKRNGSMGRLKDDIFLLKLSPNRFRTTVKIPEHEQFWHENAYLSANHRSYMESAVLLKIVDW